MGTLKSGGDPSGTHGALIEKPLAHGEKEIESPDSIWVLDRYNKKAHSLGLPPSASCPATLANGYVVPSTLKTANQRAALACSLASTLPVVLGRSKPV